MRSASTALAVVGGLAACGGGGLEVVVGLPADANLRPDHVALYIGTGLPMTGRIAPLGFTAITGFNGDWYQRDLGTRIDIVEVASGDSVVFAYQPGSSDSLAAVVAVGFQGDVATSYGKLFDLEVPSGDIHRWTIDLTPVGPAFQLWPPGDLAKACVRVDDPRTSKSAFVVGSMTDPDCDALDDGAPLECVPRTYLGTRPPYRAEISCARLAAFGQATDADSAVLGGPACVDGQGSVPGCQPSQYCVPITSYKACDRLLYPGLPEPLTCLADITQRSGVGQPAVIPTHISCRVAASYNGTTFTFCDEDMFVDGIASLLPAGVTCKSEIAIRNASPGTTFSDTVDEPTYQIRADSLDASCHFRVRPSGFVDHNTLALGALVALDIANTTSVRGLALPIVLSLEPAGTPCGAPQPCTVVQDPGPVVSADEAARLGPCLTAP